MGISQVIEKSSNKLVISTLEYFAALRNADDGAIAYPRGTFLWLPTANGELNGDTLKLSLFPLNMGNCCYALRFFKLSFQHQQWHWTLRRSADATGTRLTVRFVPVSRAAGRTTKVGS